MTRPQCAHEDAYEPDDDPGEDGVYPCYLLARFTVSREGDGYAPENLCEDHVARAIVAFAEGDDIPITVRVIWDDEDDLREAVPGD
jgi:hypothetical protein